MISIREVIVFVEDECLSQLLPIFPLPHLRQDHKALLLWLDETVEGIMAERVKLHTLSNPSHLHSQRRVTYLTLQHYLH